MALADAGVKWRARLTPLSATKSLADGGRSGRLVMFVPNSTPELALEMFAENVGLELGELELTRVLEAERLPPIMPYGWENLRVSTVSPAAAGDPGDMLAAAE